MITCKFCAEEFEEGMSYCPYCEYEIERTDLKEDKEHFPSIPYSLFVLILEVVLILVFSTISGVIIGLLSDSYDYNKELSPIIIAISLIINSSFSLFVFYLFAKKYYHSVFKDMGKGKFNYHFLYTVLPILFGVWMINSFISQLNLTDGDSGYNKFMIEIASSGGAIILFGIGIGIIGPICEEFIFRGIILRGFMSRYRSGVAILVSSLMFSLIHLNLAQIPNAFILGLVFAVLTVHTRDIRYAIYYHILNNSLVVFSLAYMSTMSKEAIKKEFAESTQSDIPFILSFFLALAGGAMVYYGLKWSIKVLTSENRALIPDKKVLNTYLETFDPHLKSEE